jgi:glyceraldehyde-3-phosphate dehydrogenase (NAD(P))
MQNAGAQITGTLDDLLEISDVAVDCTPRRVAAKNVEV